MKLQTTSSQTAGPYVHLGLTDTGSVACLADPEAKGERINLRCRVLDGDNLPVADAIVEIWQADSTGKYPHPEDAQAASSDPAVRNFGRLPLGPDGSCTFQTIKPGCVPGPGTIKQAPHILLSIFARGLLKRLVTRIYFAGDANNALDPVLAMVPEKRRDTLLARCVEPNSQLWQFDIRLCCEEETVFFDV
jgi:protocatechuate 3,4-dioxygenase alpha subunit